jgi:hypothetical protein
MPVFVALCLVLALVVQTGSPLQLALVSPVVIYCGLAIAVVTIIGSFFKMVPENICYDLFSSGSLLVWFAYWKPLFVKDSPIFFFFPVYFALITAFAALFFIGQRHKIDRDSLQRMQTFVDSGVVQPWFVMVCVLVTLYFENRFIQYPVMMTLLTMRYALSGCLRPK